MSSKNKKLSSTIYSSTTTLFVPVIGLLLIFCSIGGARGVDVPLLRNSTNKPIINNDDDAVDANGGSWFDCTTDTFEDLDKDWTFNVGNGSPNPRNLTEPTPNQRREPATHMPGWGNIELQNYVEDATTKKKQDNGGGIEIKASVRDVSQKELQSGADYLLRLQSFQKIHVQWFDEKDENPSYASEVMPTMDFFKSCNDPASCKTKFVTVGCADGDLTKCRIAFVWDNWTETYVLSSRQDNVTNIDSVTSAEPFKGGSLDPQTLWTFQLFDDASWSIRNNADGQFLATRMNESGSSELKCSDFSSAPESQSLPEEARWNMQGVFSSRLFSNKDLYPPYKVTGSIQIPNGLGTWPTFWLLPASGEERWPLSGEIDVLDHVAYENEGRSIHQVLHVKDFHGGNPKEHTADVDDASTRLVQYAVEAFRDELRLYVDGRNTFVYKNSGETGGDNYPFLKNPFNVVLNVAVGGLWGGAKGVDFSLANSTMIVKEVRHCESYKNSHGVQTDVIASPQEVFSNDATKGIVPLYFYLAFSYGFGVAFIL